MADTFLWWLTIELLGLAALPIAALLLRALPDRGYTAAKPLGLLLVGWLAYTISMLKLAPFGRGLLFVCLLLVAAFSVFLLLRGNRVMLRDMRRWASAPSFLRHILVAELLFAILFAVWAYFRAFYPNIVDQEKFMDFGILNSILKSGTMPPQDMWFAGQPLNYYYFGYLLMAAVTSLSGVAPAVSFNLANSALFGLTALLAYGTVYNLAAGTLARRAIRAAVALSPFPDPMPAPAPAPTRGRRRVPVRQAQSSLAYAAGAGRYASVVDENIEASAPSVPQRRGGAGRARELPAQEFEEEGGDEPARRVPFFLSPSLYGVLAALMLVAMGNLTTSFAAHTGNTQEGNGWRFCFSCPEGARSNWFAPSRIILDYRTTQAPDGSLQKTPVGFETINEFPAFSFVLADLHPHVMALPLTLLAVLAAYALARRKASRSNGWGDGIPRNLSGWTALVLTALIAGSLYPANTWDYPTYLLVILIGMGLPYLTAGRRRGGLRRLRPYLVQAALLVILSLALFLPFHLTFKSFAGGQATSLPDNIAGIPVVGTLLEKLSGLFLLNTADKTILGFLVIFGIFLFALLGWLGFEFIAYLRKQARSTQEGATNRTLIVAGAFLTATLLLALLLKFPLFGFLLPLITVAVYLIWQEPRRTERNMALALFAVAATIGLAVEIFYLHDNFGNRMNTLFKFYYQMWVLWSLAAAYGLWRTLNVAFGARQTVGGDMPSRVARGTRAGMRGVSAGGPSTGVKAAAGLWAVLFLLLTASALPYSWFAQQARNSVGRTAQVGLDGTAFLKNDAPGDYDAVKWLNSNATGSDVLLECCRNEYDWPGRISAFTGIPTLISWDTSHELLWRAGQPALSAEVGKRRQVVDAIYQGKDPDSPSQPMTQQRLLDTLEKYSVDYVVVGAVERGLLRSRNSGEPFDAGEQITPYAEGVMRAALPVAFQSGTTTVYTTAGAKVDPNAVLPTPGGTPGAQADPNVPPAGLFEQGAAGINRGQFNLPRGIARDGEGNFFVTDAENKRVQKFDPSGKWLLSFGSKGNEDGQFAAISEDSTGTGPGGIAVDKEGNIYVADTWNHRIQKFDRDGRFVTKWGSFLSLADPNAPNEQDKNSRFYGPRGVAVGPDGNVYVTDTGNKRVLIFDPSGKPLREISSGLTPQKLTDKYPFNQPGELNEPVGIAVDGAGNVYVADTNNGRIQKFDSAGKPSAQWPVPAGSWAPGPYLEPFLALDGQGNLYATAPTTKTVLKFSPTGELLGQKNSSGSYTLRLPTGITVDKEGKVYVVDTEANTVVDLGTIP